ncbi:YqgE/AlgH family protein [Rhodoligotrophos defluvii]|uniref:YqgE/AlgH family protein n=1 Tax=Rhodoligotrophos defluvii TaxID=2561934 RepID=UPI0010C9B14E|nr:YqgE/AlgH family protein [Rhodoligotrophos defluvii]
MKSDEYLDGKMLIAMPSIGDDRFARSVVYVCAHSAEGAMGIVVNKPADHITFPDLLERVNVLPAGERISLSPEIRSKPVQFGGPVESGRGFVLHTSDYFASDCTLPIDEGIGLTATLDVLRAIAQGRGPRRAMFALGYAGWGPGQLEREIYQNGWLHCEPDEELLFASDLASKYDWAMHKIGVDPRLLSLDIGHA